MLQRTIAMVACFVVLLGLALSPAPTLAQGRLCFQQVPDCIEGRFAEYWQQNGGLAVFGLPKSPAQQQGGLLVQQFERNRFEQHAENARPYDVLLSRLGDDLLKRQGRDWQTFPKVGGAPAGCLFFAETGHSVCPPFVGVYQANGLEFDGRRGKTLPESLALFGLPLSEPQVETLADGKNYTVQWFERARFESHPENQQPYNVLLGLLGNESLGGGNGGGGTGPTPLPPNQNALARPDRGPRGTVFAFIARGFKPGERIGVYVTLPNQGVFGAPFQTQADKEGVSDSVTFRSPEDPSVPTGIWAITFEGTSSGNKGIAYFEVTP